MTDALEMSPHCRWRWRTENELSFHRPECPVGLTFAHRAYDLLATKHIAKRIDETGDFRHVFLGVAGLAQR